MVETRSSGSRSDDTLVRVDGLEKAMAELTTHVRSLDTTLDERIRRCIEPVLRELRGTPIDEPISEAHPHKSGENALDEDASSPALTTAVPPSMALPSFDGTDALGWLARAGQYFMVNKTPDAARMDLALIALSGPALPWIQIVRRRYPSLSWSQFTRELIIRFGDNNTHDGYEALAATKQDGSLADYIALFESRLAQLPDLTDPQYMGIFLAGLKPSIRMYLQDPSTYSDAVQMAKRYENISQSLAPTTKHVSGSSSTSRYFSQPSTNHGKQAPQISAPSAASVGPRPPNRFRSMSTEEYRKHLAAGTCFKCGLKYSPTHRCPPKTLKVIVEDDDSTDEDEETGKDEEHTNSDLAAFHHLQLSELSSHGLDSYQTMKFSGTIGASSIKIMVDSGASHCFIADHMATSLGLEITPTATFSVRLGDGSKVRSGGICQNVKLGLASEEFILSCYVFPLRGVDLILGISWLASLGEVKANWRELTMEFKLSGRLVQLQGDPTLTRRACTSSELRSVSEIDDSWLLWSLEGDQALTAFGLNDTLPSSARRQLRDLLEAFPAISTAPTSLPPHRTTDHRITLQPGSEPVSVRPYRYNHTQKEEMEKLVSEMLAAGIIQPSTGPYSSPVLLVRKKDGSWRFCVDYRELNKRTVPDKYPIPVIQELLDELHGSQWFSKLDLRAGYHQIRVAPSDVAKTAFRTHSGHYEFLVMPFGLTNAPATFQSLMNDIFRPFLRKFVLVFFDDILVYSRTWEEHIGHLHQVFQLLYDHALILNPKKCILGRQHVEYLGHVVSFEGVRMDPMKIAAVMRWPTPSTVRGIRGFLGLTGYYRRFIRDYGKITAPLTSLLKKPDGKKFQWTKEADEAFQNLKLALTTAPLLRMPDFSKDFIVECDASGRGFGAVLMQENQPVAYFSKTISPQFLSKSAYEKELMALVLAIQHWRPYLLGRRFIVRTDQRSLRHLLTQSLTTPAQQNWAAKLLGYDFTIVYKKGILNRAADALSRKEEELSFAALSTPVWLDWSEVQRTLADDSTLSAIRAALMQGKQSAKHYSLSHDLLFYKGRLVIPPNSEWIPKLIAEFHMTPSGGHAGAYRTYRRLAANVYWPGMVKHVTKFVAACAICQKNKYDTRAPAGLLTPLPIPSRIWDDISMDFITGLPRAGRVDCVLVVVDRFSKYAHFLGLRHPFTARQVADLFTREIVRLHGLPTSIVSDRDPIFLSSFWQELFRFSGTSLRMSSAYHPETDGQTEVLNRCLETYLRCFSSERPKQWSKWLAWAEYCYNSSFQTAAHTTPFEVVYGRPPPTIQSFLPGEVRVNAVAEDLRARDESLAHLRFHLERAQQKMLRSANRHRRHEEFDVGDLVYLKFRPYRQSTLFRSKNRKLAPRYFGPFSVVARVGAVAYQLQLPPESRIHPVFHVSLLKKAIGATVAEPSLPEDLLCVDPPYLPELILDRRSVMRDSVSVAQVLVKWVGLSADEATWVDEEDMRCQFPFFSLVDKAVSTGKAIDSNRPWKVYTRGPRQVANYNQ